MAGRPMNRLHQDDVRKKIQASQLLNRLTDHAFGEVELSQSQIKAIEILLRKSLPDLSSVILENGTDEEGNSKAFQVIQRTIVEPKKP
jgi:hypothetical protein